MDKSREAKTCHHSAKKLDNILLYPCQGASKCPSPSFPNTHTHTRTHTRERGKELYKSLKQTDKIFVSRSYVTISPGLSPNFTFFCTVSHLLPSFLMSWTLCIFILAGLCRHMFLCHLVISVVSGRSQVS